LAKHITYTQTCTMPFHKSVMEDNFPSQTAPGTDRRQTKIQNCGSQIRNTIDTSPVSHMPDMHASQPWLKGDAMSVLKSEKKQ